jgi:transcriptional regulator with XRE-family HTH domain
MDGRQVERARKRLGLSVDELAARCHVQRWTVWRWSRDGVDGPAEALIELLLHLHQGLHAMSGRDFDKARRRDKARRGNVAAAPGSLAAQVNAIARKPRKPARSKAAAREAAEKAVADYETAGGVVKRLRSP